MSQSSRKPSPPKKPGADLGRNPLDLTDEEFAAGARERLRHYRETGLHLTHEEVVKWTEQRSCGERVPMPKPHT